MSEPQPRRTDVGVLRKDRCGIQGVPASLWVTFQVKECKTDQVARIEQQEVRWHVAQLLPRLALTAKERSKAVAILLGYLDDRSTIVRTFSLQALADIAERDEALRPTVVELLQVALSSGSPAMRTRARKLLTQLERD